MNVKKIEGYFSNYKGTEVDEAVKRVQNLDAEFLLKADQSSLDELKATVISNYSDESEDGNNLSNFALNRKIDKNLSTVENSINTLQGGITNLNKGLETLSETVTSNYNDDSVDESNHSNFALNRKIDNLSEGVVHKNEAINGGTFCKITFDINGLVTDGANLEEEDIKDALHGALLLITEIPEDPEEKNELREAFETALSSVTLKNITQGSATPVQSGAIFTALNSKQATITGAASTVTDANLVENKIIVSDSNGKIATSEVPSSYIEGLTGNIQEQLGSLKLESLENVKLNEPTQGQNLTYDANRNVWHNTSTTATVAWGGINGNIQAQSDLWDALDSKQPKAKHDVCEKVYYYNPGLTSENGVCTWTFENELGNSNVKVVVKRLLTDEDVIVGATSTSEKITITLKSPLNIEEGRYKAIVIG